MLLSHLMPVQGQAHCAHTRCIRPANHPPGHVFIGPDFDDEAPREEEAA